MMAGIGMRQGEFTRVWAEPVPDSYKWQVCGTLRTTGETVVLSQHGSREDALRGARYRRAANH